MERKILPRGYGIIEKEIMTSHLSVGAKAVYALYCSYMGCEKPEFPNVEESARYMRISEHQFMIYFNELKNARLITSKVIGE